MKVKAETRVPGSLECNPREQEPGRIWGREEPIDTDVHYRREMTLMALREPIGIALS